MGAKLRVSFFSYFPCERMLTEEKEKKHKNASFIKFQNKVPQKIKREATKPFVNILNAFLLWFISVRTGLTPMNLAKTSIGRYWMWIVCDKELTSNSVNYYAHTKTHKHNGEKCKKMAMIFFQYERNEHANISFVSILALWGWRKL